VPTVPTVPAFGSINPPWALHLLLTRRIVCARGVYRQTEADNYATAEAEPLYAVDFIIF
jgi:hypothetical protein